VEINGYIAGTAQEQTGAKAGFSNGVALLGQCQEYSASHSFRTVDLLGSGQTIGGTNYTAFFWDPSKAQVARITLAPVSGYTSFALILMNQQGNTGSLTPSVPSGHIAAPKGSGSIKDGATYILMVKQDGVGGRALSWDDRIRWPSNAPASVSGLGANIQTNCSFVSDGNFMYGTAVYNYTTT